ncbi:hypothetical protein KC318_g631 [Hortaea werneckii]|uniref:Xylanolytic transcriptional activator regulatory domain-containing protein n=1 Tax=Hortaea werneckii TaxID=91943 RepID=A0A3M7BNP6_HORWE|nr:hypothetical protein KC334_g7344 [Hortaea werneckii]KAI7026286.1 hypothetical protein KC355_g681 [Hortaea werneckii]KAI7675907.1 hypothetical protein KC318_g631 [Hortaea werneckii]RMY41236.1 hypothetical protein D0866_00729 [Hortaea werneckii]
MRPNRISKLEGLVESLSGEVGMASGSPGPEDSSPAEESASIPQQAASDPDNTASPTVGKYMGSTFWSSLTTEVQALRDALEEDQGDDEPEPTSPTTSSNGLNAAPSANEYDFIICPPTSIYVMPGALEEPSPQMQAILYGTFIENVAPMFKVFHIPTLRRFVERGMPYLGQDPGSLPNRAVKASLWFSAVNTISDNECQVRFHQTRATLMQQYRRIVDVLLAQADVMNTSDLAVLQAFVTTLIASRISNVSRRAWTMTALVVRIARAMDLHHEVPGRTAFETELRRRAWHAIRFLDVFTAMDRATEPIITGGSYTTPRPNNVNDSEFDDTSNIIPNHENRLTDMAFALLASEATGVTQRLNTPEIKPSGDTWQLRLEIAQSFGKQVHEKYVQHCDMSIPFHRLISAIAKSMSAGMVLRAVRPMQRHVSSVPPRIDSPYVLRIAVDALRENEKIYEDPEAERWRWLVWVQWHPLAVALAGLCSIRGAPLAAEAWSVVDKSYTRHSMHVADTRNGMLWRPIEKLYKKAQSFRDAGKRSPQPVAKQTLTPPADLNSSVPPPFYNPPSFQNSLPPFPDNPAPLDPMMITSPMHFNAMTASPDFNFANDPLMNPAAPPPAGDANSWLDWENIMSDFESMPMDVGDDFSAQAYPSLPEGQRWPNVLHNDLV